MSKSTLRKNLILAAAPALLLAGLATGVTAQSEPSAAPTIQVITPPPGTAPKVEKGLNWKATDPKNLNKLRETTPKAKVQVLVVSAEELAAMGVKGNGRIIYRYVDGLLQIIVTSQDAAAAVVAAFPEHVAEPPSNQAPPEVPQGPGANPNPPGTPNGNAPIDNPPPAEDPFQTPGNNPDINPGDFHENPTQENVSPS